MTQWCCSHGGRGGREESGMHLFLAGAHAILALQLVPLRRRADEFSSLALRAMCLRGRLDHQGGVEGDHEPLAVGLVHVGLGGLAALVAAHEDDLEGGVGAVDLVVEILMS